MRAVVNRAVTGPDGGERRINEMLGEINEFKGCRNVYFMIAPHAIYTCSQEYLMKLADIAEELALPVHIHLSESVAEMNDCLRDHGCTPVEYLVKMGFFKNYTVEGLASILPAPPFLCGNSFVAFVSYYN